MAVRTAISIGLCCGKGCGIYGFARRKANLYLASTSHRQRGPDSVPRISFAQSRLNDRFDFPPSAPRSIRLQRFRSIHIAVHGRWIGSLRILRSKSCTLSSLVTIVRRRFGYALSHLTLTKLSGKENARRVAGASKAIPSNGAVPGGKKTQARRKGQQPRRISRGWTPALTMSCRQHTRVARGKSRWSFGVAGERRKRKDSSTDSTRPAQYPSAHLKTYPATRLNVL